MNAERLATLFGAGMAAAVNPCGFALLPAYLSYYLGMTDDAPDRTRRPPAIGAVVVGASMTAGFLIVFALVGIVWSSISSTVAEHLPWVTVAMGLALIVMGGFMVSGRQPTVRLPKMRGGAGDGTVGSMVVFGMAYAVASLSCTIPLFVGAMGLSFDASFLDGVVGFMVYGLGMGAVVTLLTVAVALAKTGFVASLRRLLPHMTRIAGVLVIVAGVIVAFYGWSETRATMPGFARWLLDRQSDVSSLITRVGAVRLGLIILVLISGAVAASAVLRRPAQE